MTEILQYPPDLASVSSSITFVSPINNDGFHQHSHEDNDCLPNLCPVALYRRDFESQQDEEEELCSGLGKKREREEVDQLSIFAALVTVFRKSFVGCKSEGGRVEGQVSSAMEISCPTNVRHVAHVTFDRFNGFLGLPVEFEPEVPRRPPSASTRVFGVSTESMQLSFDSRGNSVPTILLLMQRRLYAQGGLQAEGIFRINAENGQEESVREQLNSGLLPDNVDVHCLAGLIKAWFRELPTALLDSLPPEQVMQAHTEEQCLQLIRLLPATEAALLDWALNLMADVAQMEHFNKMNARNVAMVFAPNMTQMADPLTALMFAVQVMNFLKTLIERVLREREDSIVETALAQGSEHSDESGDHGGLQPITREKEVENEDQVLVAKEEVESSPTSNPNQIEPKFHYETHDILLQEKGNKLGTCGLECGDISLLKERNQSKIRRTKSGHASNSGAKKASRKIIDRPVIHDIHLEEKGQQSSIISRINWRTERLEAWR